MGLTFFSILSRHQHSFQNQQAKAETMAISALYRYTLRNNSQQNQANATTMPQLDYHVLSQFGKLAQNS